LPLSSAAPATVQLELSFTAAPTNKGGYRKPVQLGLPFPETESLD
jgi:hypothetical protein